MPISRNMIEKINGKLKYTLFISIQILTKIMDVNPIADIQNPTFFHLMSKTYPTTLIIQLNAFSWKEFDGHKLTREERCYRHIVIIKKNGYVIDHDMYVTEDNVVGLGKAKISKSMFLGESGSYSYTLDLNKDEESGCQDQPKGYSSECNVQKFVAGYFTSQGLKFYSPARLWLGISFILMPLACLVAFAIFIPEVVSAMEAYLGMFMLFGIYLVVTCKQAFNNLKLAGVTFIFVPLILWGATAWFDDLFFKLVIGFFIVLFIPMGIGMYVAGYKQDNA